MTPGTRKFAASALTRSTCAIAFKITESFAESFNNVSFKLKNLERTVSHKVGFLPVHSSHFGNVPVQTLQTIATNTMPITILYTVAHELYAVTLTFYMIF